ncbi:MAG: polyhydroxyalkanoate depolymerase, partial [Novosphingobium sp.]
MRDTRTMRTLATICEIPARSLKTYTKPRYQIWEQLGDLDVVVDQQVVHSLPFADLLRFDLDNGVAKPKVLIAAALSGHYGTLLNDTVRGFTQDFDTYITDWKDARQVPLSEGEFGFDDYVDHLIAFMEVLGPGTHLVATCQAAPPAMVAAALLAKRKSPNMPGSLTLMGGPVDTRVNPGAINRLAEKLPLALFEKANIHKIPKGYPGSGRRVYPGFYQLSGFIALNPMPHVRQYKLFIKNSLRGYEAPLGKFREFYDEYFAVLDMTEAFYIETLRKVFMEHHIGTDQMFYRGEKVDFASIKDMPLLTVEGANDHLCPPGQTEAAHDVFRGIPPKLRKHYVQEGVGHYGVFSGSKFQSGIYPVIRDFALQFAKKTAQPALVKA